MDKITIPSIEEIFKQLKEILKINNSKISNFNFLIPFEEVEKVATRFQDDKLEYNVILVVNYDDLTKLFKKSLTNNFDNIDKKELISFNINDIKKDEFLKINKDYCLDIDAYKKIDIIDYKTLNDKYFQICNYNLINHPKLYN